MSDGAPVTSSGVTLSRPDRHTRKNLMKISAIQKILKMKGLSQTCPVKETHISYTDNKLQQTTVRRYKQGGSSNSVNVKVSQNNEKVTYTTTYIK